jgi:hypothetical protein
MEGFISHSFGNKITSWDALTEGLKYIESASEELLLVWTTKIMVGLQLLLASVDQAFIGEDQQDH